MKPYFLLFLLLGQFVIAQVQDSKIHSHNDYKQDKPFWEAYENKSSSIEVDVFLRNGTLYVTHHKKEIIVERTIETLYLDPMKQVFAAESTNHRKLQLLIDIKSEAKSTLKKLIETLGEYEGLLENESVSFIISGNRPPVENYLDYPDFILFDYQSLSNIENIDIWKKIALISLPFYKYSKWDGKTQLIDSETKSIETVIEKAHEYNKPFRFWATPDTELAWGTFSKMGIDFINTDMPSKCRKFLGSIKKEQP